MNAITPYRGTLAKVWTVEPSPTVRRAYRYSRTAAEMGLADSTYGTSTNVRRIANDAWVLSPHLNDPMRGATSDYAVGQIDDSNAEVAAGLEYVYLREKPLYAGLGANAGVLGQSLKAARIRRTPNSVWSDVVLTVDSALFPGPTIADKDYPLDRVLVGRTTYPANTPFIIGFWNGGTGGPSALANFYFGGPADVAPDTAHGGEFCLTLYGNGECKLWERDGITWDVRFSFNAREGASIGTGFEAILILPYGANKIAFGSVGADGIAAPFLSGSIPLITSRATKATSLYNESTVTSGHTHKVAITGPGIVRYDHVRVSRGLPILTRAVFPYGGTIVDQPFSLQYPAFEGQTLQVNLKVTTPPHTLVTASLFNANTKSLCAQNGGGEWVLDAGVRDYYWIFDLTTDDGMSTPVITGWEIHTVGKKNPLVGVSYLVPCDWESGITVGPVASDPLRWQCRWAIHDQYHAYDFLGDRAAYRFDLITTYDPNDPAAYSVLGSFESARDGIMQSYKRNQTGAYRYYDVTGTSLFARLTESFVNHLLNYFEDAAADPDPVTGVKPPWKITDILNDLFRLAGLDDTEFHVPDIDLRLWAGPANTTDFLIAPQSRLGPLLLKFVQDYLEALIFFDGNASNGGAQGIWRVKDRPQAPYTPLVQFGAPPIGPGMSVHDPNSYGDGKTFIASDTFHWRVSRPEANIVTVIGVGAKQSDHAGSMRLQQTLVNPASMNFDPDSTSTAWSTNRDGIGRAVEVVFVDPTLTTQEAVNAFCRRLYDRCAHAWEGATWDSPLLLVTDEGDELQVAPRPLRQGDAVTIPNKDHSGYVTALITSTPDIRTLHGDNFQWAGYEAVVPDAITGNIPLRALYGLPGIELQEQGARDQASAALGVTGREIRIFSAHQMTAQQLQSVLSLPITLGDAIQDPDDGALFFVGGVSDPGGTDILMRVLFR